MNLATILKERREMEMDLKGIEERISKFQEQRWVVKTNRECSAILGEIEAAQAQISVLEEKILLNMEAGDNIEQAIKTRKEELRLAREQFEKEKKEHLSRLAMQEKELQGFKHDKADLEKMLTRESLALFERTAAVRGGIAISRVEKGHCKECHMRLRPQFVQDIKANQGILLCENCSRILYYQEEKAEQQAWDEEKTSSSSGE